MAVESNRGGITKGIAQFIQKVGDFCPSDWSPKARAETNARRTNDEELRVYLTAYLNFMGVFNPIRHVVRLFNTDMPIFTDVKKEEDGETFLDLRLENTDEFHIFSSTTDVFQRRGRNRHVNRDVMYLDRKSNIIKLFESDQRNSRNSRETERCEHKKELISTLDVQPLHTFLEKAKALERIIPLLERVGHRGEEQREYEIWEDLN